MKLINLAAELAITLIVKLVLWLTILLCVKPVDADDRNTQLLASVRVGASGGCSGTTFAADDRYAYVVAAGHCIRSGETAVGQKVGICTVDGKVHQAEWIAFDDHIDLAVARVPRAAALALTPIASAMPINDGSWTAIGFPRTVGPNFKTLGVASVSDRTRTANGWHLPVESGRFADGDSGGGVFDRDKLIGIITHSHRDGAIIAASHNQLVQFVSSVPAVAKSMGLPECPDGICKVCPKCGKIHAPADGWKPQPNVPIVLPRDGTFPDRQSSAYLVELVKRVDRQDKLIAELQAAVAALQVSRPGTPDVAPPPIPAPVPTPTPQRGETGPQGNEGPVGPPGPKPTPSELLEIVERVVATNRDGLRGLPGPPGLVVVEVRKPNGAKDEFKAAHGGRVIVDVAEVVKPKTKGK